MNLDNTLWKDIPSWRGLYQAHPEGYIRSVPRNGTRRKPHIMAISVDAYGYGVCKLRNKDKVVSAKVHRLIAETFVPNPDNKPQVNHKDGNKLNNHYTNLDWVTPSENILHAKRLGLQQDCHNRQPVQQLTLEGEVVATYPSLKEAEVQTGIHWTGISAVTRGKRKTAGGYKWRRFND